MDQLRPTNRDNMAHRNEPVGSKKSEVKSSKIENKAVHTSKTPLPSGWKEEACSNSGEVVYISPEGMKMMSKLALVEYLVKSKSDPQTIYTLWNTLDDEGWVMGGELLPPGWRVKPYRSLLDYKYLTREMNVFNTSKEALKHIVDFKDYSEENEENFKKWYSDIQRKVSSVQWKNDASLPTGWKLASGQEYESIKDVDGNIFDGRKDAIDHMIKEHYPPTDIFNLWNTLHLEGWVDDELHLPTGWKKKFHPSKKTYHYLSPMMEVVKTAEALLNIVKSGKEYTKEEVENIQSLL